MYKKFKSKLKTFFPALKHRNFRLFFLGQGISLIGTYLQSTAEQWLVYAVLTHSKLALGILSAAQTLPITFFSLLAGDFADRKDKRKILIYTQTLMTVLAFIGAFLVYTNKIQFWQVMVLGALLGLATAFDWPTRQAFWPEIVTDRHDITSAVSLNVGMYNSARAIGPAIAAIAIGAIGIAACYFLNGFSFLAVILALFLMKTKPVVKPIGKNSVLTNIRQGFSYLKHHHEPLFLIILISAVSLFIWSFTTLMPVYAKDILKGNEQTFGLLGIAAGVGAAIGALMVNYLGEKFGQSKVLFISCLSLIIFLFIFAYSRNLTLSIILLAIIGFSFANFAATDNSLLQIIIPDEIRGRIMGIYVLMFGGVAPFGSIYITLLANYFGAPFAVASGLLIALIIFLVVFYYFKLGRRLELLLRGT